MFFGPLRQCLKQMVGSKHNRKDWTTSYTIYFVQRKGVEGRNTWFGSQGNKRENKIIYYLLYPHNRIKPLRIVQSNSCKTFSSPNSPNFRREPKLIEEVFYSPPFSLSFQIFALLPLHYFPTKYYVNKPWMPLKVIVKKNTQFNNIYYI